jgi:HAE1 family hydrophobic/amphiphilic exporter-1
MSLGGLTLGIGMLVDNAIVVLESIFRRRREGQSLTQSAVAGTGEVGGAVVASTLTTVAVFLPIVFVEGIAGQLFGDMALTVTFSIVASLLVAVTLIPMLSAIGSDVPRSGMSTGAPSRPMGGDFSLGAISRGYDRLLRESLRTPVFTIGVAALLLGASLWATRFLGSELIPQVSEGEFFFEVTMPEGTPLDGTDQALLAMEAIVSDEPRVARQFSSVGRRFVSGGLSLDTEAEHYGQLNVTLVDREDEAAELAVAEALRTAFASIPDLRVREGRPAYFSLATPIEIVVFGEDLVLLDEVTDAILSDVTEVPGLVDVRSSLEEGSPELQVIFDRDRLASLGLDVATLSQTLQQRVQGAVATQFKEADRQIDIRVRNAEKDRTSAADVRNLVVEGPEGPIRLLTVAEVREARGPAEIHRLQQQRAAVISANVEGRPLGEVVDDLRRTLARADLPPEVTVEIGGQNREMEVSFGSLRFAIGLAIFLTYLVMAATFESLLHPFIVLFAIPLALVGVVLGLLVTGTEVSVIVLIGTVMLVGIVVNNAIVLIDTVNQLRRSGVEKVEAVIRAGHIRLRPILMTTLTTVLGLLPMSLAVGEGSELRAPLAITVSWGLLFSTLLTLVVIPAAYRLVPSRIRPEEAVGASPAASPVARG